MYGAVQNGHWGPGLLRIYWLGVGLNIVVALPVQILVVSPVVRKLFARMFPPAGALNKQIQ
ncbi:hypothetical protein D3C73_1669130 [compost metagenome]